MSEILPDIVAEGRRLLGLAAAAGAPLRLLGGVAVAVRAVGALPAELRRSYGDLDFVAARGSADQATTVFEQAGYASNTRFNAVHARERLQFFDEDHERHVDVFVGAFRMCHEIPLDGRLDADPSTIPPAELLLTKLQVVELNEKDVRDAVALLHTHGVGDGDETVDAGRVAELCAADWGLWRTITQNVDVVAAKAGDYGLSAADRERLTAGLAALSRRIEDEPKGRSWRLRARIGDRKRWYELPEEVA